MIMLEEVLISRKYKLSFVGVICYDTCNSFSNGSEEKSLSQEGGKGVNKFSKMLTIGESR